MVSCDRIQALMLPDRGILVWNQNIRDQGQGLQVGPILEAAALRDLLGAYCANRSLN